MKLLVLGGTAFLSRAVAAEAAARGHDVVAAARGRSGTVPDGVRHVVVDRDGGLPPGLTSPADGPFDAVVDVARTPSHVRTAVAALPDAHWVFVSTINVYADDVTPGGGPGTLPLRAPLSEDVELGEDPEAYGRMKVACEELVTSGARSRAVVRPGLIVGPGDPTGRFTYWPARMSRVLDGDAGVLAPGSPTDLVQLVDVRDLAAWLVDLAETRTEGVFDGVAPPLEIGELLTAVAAGCDARPTFRWLDRAALEAADVRPWAGERSLPLWLPRPEYEGMATHDAGPALEAGLVPRPVAETARDTLAWLRATPGAVVTGLTAAQEAQVLAASR